MPARKPQPSNRLTWTLGLLVLCMSVGFGGLNWLHGLSAVASTPRALQANRQAQPWNTIVVHPVAGDSRNLPFHHFYINTHGVEQFTTAWRQTRQDSAHSRTIHVALAMPRSSGLSPRQWETVVARLRTLQARYEIPGRNIGLDLSNADVDASAQQDLDQLESMFRTAGWAR